MTAGIPQNTAPATSSLPRSPELMSRDDTGLLVIDMQVKLLQLIGDHGVIAWNVRRLLDGARLLGLPCCGTEQYPKGLGATEPGIAQRLAAGDANRPLPSKTQFSCGACGQLAADWEAGGVRRLLLCGIETHVCVQQTAFDLLAAGYRVYVAVDAVGSRYALDKEIALRRMETAGVVLTTTEAAMFEWCQRSDIPEFKQISQLVKESPPAAGGIIAPNSEISHSGLR